MNRLVAKQFPDSTATTYSYTPTGQRASITDNRGVTTYAYDERERLISRTDPDGRQISYTYDLASNRTSVTIPSGTTIYTFDALNRLDTVTDPNSGLTDYTYDAVGNLIRTDLPNGTYETRDYDDLNRLLFLENRNSAGVISSYHYTLNPVGYRTAVEEHDGRRVDYNYDLLYRLTQEQITDTTNGNRTTAYTYDPVGNRLTQTDSVEGNTIYSYDANDRLLSEATNSETTTYSYDNNGNTRSKVKGADQTLYDWDYENRLIGATVTTAAGAQQLAYQYNSDGIRVASVVDGQETRYLIDTIQPYAQVLEEYSPNGTVLVSYVYGHDLISQERSGSQIFYHVDGLGSTRVLTDINGNVTDTGTYGAFGNLIASSGSTENAYGFAGEQFDSGLDQYYLRARYYDQESGRFTRRDEYEGRLGEPLTLHKYMYANGNPSNFVDPSGLTPLSDVVLAFRRVGLLSSLSPRLAFAQAGGYAHRAIEADILSENFSSGISVEVPVNGGQIDVLELPNAIYEIKPFDGVVNPHIQLDKYIRMNPERNFFKGTYTFEGRVENPPFLTGITLSYVTDEPGVITYYPNINQLGLTMIASAVIAIQGYFILAKG